MLKKCGFTRRAQAVTWQAWMDLGIGDPSCLQRLWFRIQDYKCDNPDCYMGHNIIQSDGGGRVDMGGCDKCNGKEMISKLNMIIHIRSNDSFKAGFMNMYAFTELQKYVADRVGVEVGEYVHIYGSYFKEFEGFLKLIEKKPNRFFDTQFSIPMFIDGCDELLKESDMPNDKRLIIENRKNQLQGELKNV